MDAQNRQWKTIGGVVAFLASAATIITLIVQLYSLKSDIASAQEQVAIQKTQIALSAEHNRILAEQGTVTARQAQAQQQLLVTPAVNDGFAPTATALASANISAQATQQALEVQRQRIEATQTAIALPQPASVVVVRASDVIPQIKGEDGEIEKILSWWRVDAWGNESGQLNPSSYVPDETCFGLAWNTNEFGYHRLVVFQKPKTLTFAAGGWYVKVCAPKTIQISPEDVGRIQADWLGKRYGIDDRPWEVVVN